jgi:hypothetical protein
VAAGAREWRIGASALLCGLVACGAPSSGPLAEPGFDAARAFRDLCDQVAIGPRESGSDGAAKTRALIGERLRQAGWRVELHAVTARAPDGTARDFVNVIGRRAGSGEGLVLAVTHYDTKRIPGVRFVGANDGASGVAVLLEAARQLGSRALLHETWLVFFDGEEAFGPSITADDGLYGSRALARRMAADGSLARIHSLLLVDMVADADLNLAPDIADAPRLARLLREVARAQGLESALDSTAVLGLVDDHTPFAEAGVETLALIDFQFGARRTPGPFWHTARDDLAAVSEASLNTSGRLLLGVLGRLLLPGQPAGAAPSLRYSLRAALAPPGETCLSIDARESRAEKEREPRCVSTS